MMVNEDEESDSEAPAEDDIDDGAHGDVDEVEDEEDIDFTKQLPDCLCFFSLILISHAFLSRGHIMVKMILLIKNLESQCLRSNFSRNICWTLPGNSLGI